MAAFSRYIFYVILQSLSNSSNSWFGIMDMQHFGESTLIDMSAEWLGSNIRQSSEILVNDSKQRLAFGNPAHVTLDGYSDDYTYCKWGSILLCIAPTARLLDHIWEEEKSRNDNERNKSRWILRPCSVGLEVHGQTGSITVTVFVYTEPDSHGEGFNHNFWENVHSDGHEGDMPSSTGFSTFRYSRFKQKPVWQFALAPW